MDELQLDLIEILQAVENRLLSQHFDDITIATERGSWRWRAVARARDLSKPPEGTEPTDEEMAVRLISASPQDHAKLSELIAGEFARRRLA